MILVLALQLAAAQGPTADAIRSLATGTGGSALVDAVRSQPDSAREALRRMFAELAFAPPAEVTDGLAAARRVGDAYAAAWHDPFLQTQVERFARWSVRQRRTKVQVDSLRLAGNTTMGRTGPQEAAALWDDSRRLALAIHDTAGVAAALGNMGAGMLVAERYDSAVVLLRQAQALAEAIGDHRTTGNALGMLAAVAREQGQLERARSLLTSARTARLRAGDRRGAASDANTIGLIAQSVGDTAGARAAFADALSENQQQGRLTAAATNLVNLGSLALARGDFAGADRRYTEALDLCRRAGEPVEAAAALGAMGILAIRRADYRAARRLLTEAAETFAGAGMPGAAVDALLSRAQAERAMGDLQEALMSLRRADQLRSETPQAGASAHLSLAKADLALELNDLTVADEQFRQAERLALAAGNEGARSIALQGRAVLATLQRDDDRAADFVTAARRTIGETKDPRIAADLALVSGYVDRVRDTAAAARALDEARRRYLALGDSVMAATALAHLGDMALEAGQPLTAIARYERGLSLLRERLVPSARWPLYHGLGRARLATGNRTGALEALRTAAMEVELTAATLRLEERRADFLSDKWDVHVDLALVERSAGTEAAAFLTSERLRARQLLDMLARGRLTPAAADGLIDQEQDLRLRISELTRQLERQERSAPGVRGPAEGGTSPATREALLAAQRAYADLVVELKDADPRYAELVIGEPLAWDGIARRLPARTALIEYVVTDSTTLAFVVLRSGLASADLGVGRHTLARLTEFARGTLRPPGPQQPTLDGAAALRQLHAYLVEPLERAGLLRGVDAILIAPHQELHYLPFAALRDGGGRYLIERFAIGYVPSGSTWARLAERTPAVGSAVLALAPHTRTLPGSQDEVEAVGRALPKATVLLGAQATERALRDGATRYDVIHLATYGVLNTHNPMFSHVSLAPDPRDDGQLEVGEVYGLRLAARLVVLSACQTALGSGELADVPPGDDWVGLARAFLQAGAGNVVATLWPVADRATARFMTLFYGRVAAGSADMLALAEAQRAAIKDTTLANPFYWAGFALFAGR